MKLIRNNVTISFLTILSTYIGTQYFNLDIPSAFFISLFLFDSGIWLTDDKLRAAVKNSIKEKTKGEADITLVNISIVISSLFKALLMSIPVLIISSWVTVYFFLISMTLLSNDTE